MSRLDVGEVEGEVPAVVPMVASAMRAAVFRADCTPTAAVNGLCCPLGARSPNRRPQLLIRVDHPVDDAVNPDGMGRGGHGIHHSELSIHVCAQVHAQLRL